MTARSIGGYGRSTRSGSRGSWSQLRCGRTPPGRRSPRRSGSRSGWPQSASRPGDAAVLGQRRPQRRGLAQAARAQLQPDQRGEGLLGRTAGGPAAAERLGQAVRVGQPVGARRGPRRGRPSPRPGRARSPAGPGRPSAAGVSSGVKMPSSWTSRIDSGLVGSIRPIASSTASRSTVMPARVRLDGVEDVAAQPRHVAEEPLVGGLAQGHVQAHLVLGDLQALAVRGDVGRDERGGAGRAERQADVAGREHLGRRASRARCRAGRRRRRRRAR